MPTTLSPEQIRREFDAIARLMPEDDDRATPYERWLWQQLPPRGEAVLEIGCGVGSLARRLAARFERVVAIDSSGEMIAEAQRRTRSGAAIEYICTDLFEWLARAPEAYDCIVSVATLHHVDLASALRSMSRSLRPGGTLLVVDVLGRGGVVMNAAAWLVAAAREALLLLRRPTPWKLRAAYRRHGRSETYLSLDEVQRIASEELPGAEVRARLLWRYTIHWRR